MKYFGLIILFIFHLNTFSQSLQNYSSLNLYYDNDFFSGIDRYYTQGIRIEFISPFCRKLPTSKLLISPSSQSLNYYGLAIEQDGFTPISIRKDTIQKGERPYCGSLFLSENLLSISTEKKLRLTTQFDIGLIGPAAKGEEEQKAIHHAIHGLEPLGWKYQIQNDLILNYKIKVEKAILSKKICNVIVCPEARIGTMYDDLRFGMQVQLGLNPNYFNSMSNSFSKRQNRNTNLLHVYLFATGNTKAVLYNATLEGGVFNRSNSYTLSTAEIKRMVYSSEVGIVLSTGKIKISYSKFFLSPEFSQGLLHKWGHCNLNISF